MVPRPSAESAFLEGTGRGIFLNKGLSAALAKATAVRVPATYQAHPGSRTTPSVPLTALLRSRRAAESADRPLLAASSLDEDCCDVPAAPVLVLPHHQAFRSLRAVRCRVELLTHVTFEASEL